MDLSSCHESVVNMTNGGAVAVRVLPLEPRRLGFARAGVEQIAHHGDGYRMIRFRTVERPANRGELQSARRASA